MTLSLVLDPASVAIIGASENPDKIGGRPVNYLARFGYRGQVFPINPNRRDIQELPAYPSLEALPHAPDVAIIAVPGEMAVASVDQCADLGVKIAIMMALGFGETEGGQGAGARAGGTGSRPRHARGGAEFAGVGELRDGRRAQLLLHVYGSGAAGRARRHHQPKWRHERRALRRAPRPWHRDPVFGPVILLGDGGKYVEAVPDTALLLPPFTKADALDALDSLRIAPVLHGVRGEPPVDFAALAAAAVVIGRLMLDDPTIVSLDVNPLLVGSAGEGVTALDAVVMVSA